MSELYFLGWLRSEKEAIINGDSDFQNALNDALIYQTIETQPERISKIKPYDSMLLSCHVRVSEWVHTL